MQYERAIVIKVWLRKDVGTDASPDSPMLRNDWSRQSGEFHSLHPVQDYSLQL